MQQVIHVLVLSVGEGTLHILRLLDTLELREEVQIVIKGGFRFGEKRGLGGGALISLEVF